MLVLGAGGFIGRRVLAALQACDWARPVAGTRRPARTNALGEQLHLDATDERSLDDALGDIDAVVNCIAGDARTIRTNAAALFAAAARSPRRPRVVFLSSMAVYGRSIGRVNEAAPLGDGADAYGSAKVAAERCAAAYERSVVLRPGIVFGPESFWWSAQIGRLLLQRRLGALGPAGSGTCNLLYIEDMARAVLQALREPGVEGSCFNLAMADPPTWNDYFMRYARALEVPGVRITPLRLAVELRGIGPVLKVVERLARTFGTGDPPPPIRPWLLQLTAQRIVLDVSAAEQRLRLQWSALDPALAITAAWTRRALEAT